MLNYTKSRLQILFIILFTALFAYNAIAQEMGLLKKGIEISFPEKIHKLVLDPLPTGTYSVGTGGYFPTIDSAFNKLSIDGIAGEVILELIDNLYTAPTDQYGFFLNGPIPGAGPNSRVTIKPADNKNVIIEGNGRSVLWLLNTSYVTFDGVGLTGATTLQIHSLHNAAYSSNDGIDFINNSDHNIIQNIVFIDEDESRNSGSGFWCIAPGGSFVPDSNLIQNNFVKQAGIALYLSAYGSPAKGIGNIIRGNQIGSESDSLISWGIQVEQCQNTIVENNIVQNIKCIFSPASGLEIISLGINSFSGTGDIIRNNIVHNIKSDNGYASTGLLLSGGTGSNNMLYNNMVYDIQSTSTLSNSRVSGIQFWNQHYPKIYYNTVYLSGNGANALGSAGFYLYGGFGGSVGTDLKNNIFVNTRDESPYCASSIYSYSSLGITSDNNDLFYIQNGNNCLVNAGGIDYLTLEDWQVLGQDLNSISEMPNFIEPYLHIDVAIPTKLESGGIPIAGIENDFDGDIRNAITPDIGADEFDGIVPVELTSFTATVGGNEIALNWSTATETNNLGFEIHRSTENTAWTMIGFIKGKGTSTEPQTYSFIDQNLKPGKYLYRLKQIDFNGTYEYSDIAEAVVGLPVSFSLSQNYPNPFNPVTTIKFSIPKEVPVNLSIYNLLGERIKELKNEVMKPGYYEVEFSAESIASGIYFYRINAEGFVQTKKMILLK